MRLANKLIIGLIAIVTLLALASAMFVYKSEERQLLNLVTLGADQLSGSIASATWHAMLADRRDDAYQVMGKIAEKQGIDRIRMFNREGFLTYSTFPGDLTIRDAAWKTTCQGCHETGKNLLNLSLPDRIRVQPRPGGGRNLSVITPITNEPSCSEAECHAHPKSMKVLGVLEVRASLDDVDQELAEMQARIFWRAVVELAILCPFFVYFTRRMVRRPIEKLIRSAEQISDMNLDAPIVIPKGSGEVADLARSFDKMRVELKSALGEINEFTQKLETRVEERTRELQLAHKKLMHSDRLASLGQLSASVAHEINNPIAGILNLSTLMQRIINKNGGLPESRVDEFRKYLDQTVNETSRVGKIVSGLLAFSRRPSSPYHAETDLNAIIQSTTSLVAHKLKLAGAEVLFELDATLPLIVCDRSQIQQAVLNLVMNAAEAMHTEGGRLLIESGRKDADTVFFRVTDTGEGIAPENISRIFDPFFTTKPEGKGVGLGLAVTYGIIQAHQGEIDVKSTPGQGTSFTVTLPLKPVPAAKPSDQVLQA